MYSLPTAFSLAYQRSGQINHVIVKLTDGSTTWYISEKDMQIGSTHVYGILKSLTSIKRSVNLFKKTWSVGNVTLSIHNMRYRKDTSSAWLRLSDEIDDIIGNQVVIYLLAGSQVTSISSDCLEYFVGYIYESPKYNNDTIQITILSAGYMNNKILPQNTIGDIYSSTLWLTNKDRKIPIVYGKFDSISDSAAYSPDDSNGLAVTEKISGYAQTALVVSDHQCDALGAGEIYHKINGLDVPANYASGDITVTLNDSGRTTVVVAFDATAYAYFLMSDASSVGTVMIFYDSDCTDYENTIDGDDASYGQVKDDTDSGSGSNVFGGVAWFISNIDFLRDKIPNDSSDPQPDEYIEDVKLQYKIVDDFTPDGIGAIDFMNAWALLSPTVQISYTSSSSRQISSDLISNLYGVNFDALFLRFGDVDAGDGVQNNQNLTKVYDCRIRCQMSRRAIWEEKFTSDLFPVLNRSQFMGISGWPTDNKIFVGCDGRAYGSWIDSRSSNYSSGDCIEDPAGIIESILRDELGYVDADIDLTTFIDAENTSVTMRINIHNENQADAEAIIQHICRQATFAFVYLANGKARLIPMNDNSPTTDLTILYSWIKDGIINVSKTDFIINKLELHSRYQQEYGGLYRDLDIIENSTSQAADYGQTPQADPKKYTARWPNICGTPATHVANHLIRSADGSASDGDGIWCKPHNKIELEAIGFTCIALQLGDWIELDDATVDPHIKCFGSSWSGKQFIVTGLNLINNGNGLKIEAVELF